MACTIACAYVWQYQQVVLCSGVLRLMLKIVYVIFKVDSKKSHRSLIVMGQSLVCKILNPHKNGFLNEK